MIKSSPGLTDGCCIAQHANGPVDFGLVTTRHNRWCLIVDAHLEASRTPVDELNGPLRLDSCDGDVDVFRNDVTSV